MDFIDLIKIGLGFKPVDSGVDFTDEEDLAEEIKNKKRMGLKKMELERLVHKKIQQEQFEKWCKPSEWYPDPVFIDA